MSRVYWAVSDKAKRNRKLSASQRKRNKKHASDRKSGAYLWHRQVPVRLLENPLYWTCQERRAGVFDDGLGESALSPEGFAGDGRITAPAIVQNREESWFGMD